MSNRIILIGNYPLDKQESMKRFALMLEEGFNKKSITTELWEPKVFFAAFFKSSNSGIGKWLGYIDKWMLFPFILKLRLLKKKYKNSKTTFHICDHSNAPYLKSLPINKTVITCHDVLAIRGALGYKDAYCPASGMGKILQNWILSNLKQAKKLAAVSYFTLNQLIDLSASAYSESSNWVVIHNAFNADFKPVDSKIAKALLAPYGLDNIPYILHVGSSLERKNRSLLLKMRKSLGNKWEGKVVFAGKPIDDKLQSEINLLGLEDKVVSVVKPNHNKLLALYSSAEAFIFPSLSEGFGWPLIEAQACGTPVIASNLEPMPEVSDKTALHEDPLDAEAFAEAFLSLNDAEVKSKLIKSGFKNIERFAVDKMIDAYINLHNS